MTTSGMSYGAQNNEKRNGLQDEKKIRSNDVPKLPPGLIPSNNYTHNSKNDLPNVLLCFKSLKSDKKEKKDKEKKEVSEEETKESARNKKRSKSRELRGGILYVGCDCERRNGLQDQCPRSECQGSPECLTVPPTCPPSEFANAKHLAKIYAELAKKREEFAEKLKNAEGGDTNSKTDKKNKSKDKIDYDCFPLDKLIAEGQPCPICDRLIDSCTTHSHTHPHTHPHTHTHEPQPQKDKQQKEPDIYVGPIIIDFPVDCLCCPQAC